VAVINQTLARDFFSKEDPVGQKINFKVLDEVPETPHGLYFEIIGVVSDAKNRGLQAPVTPEAFLPYTIWAEAQPEGCRVIFSTGCGCTWGNRSIHWR